MQYRVDLVNTKAPDNTKILIVEANSSEEAQRKAEKSVNPDDNYLIPEGATVYRTVNVQQETKVWEVSVTEEDGSQRVIGYQ